MVQSIKEVLAHQPKNAIFQTMPFPSYVFLNICSITNKRSRFTTLVNFLSSKFVQTLIDTSADVPCLHSSLYRKFKLRRTRRERTQRVDNIQCKTSGRRKQPSRL